MDRLWTGRVRQGSEAEHEEFITWLRSVEGQSLLDRSLLTSYRLAEQDGRVTVSLGADEPTAMIKFLRNRRFWPDFWQFESADPEQAAGSSAQERVSWRK